MGSKIEELYEKWRHGVLGDDDVMRGVSQCTEPGKDAFRTLYADLRWEYLAIPIEGDVESWTESDVVRRARQVSGESSIEVSGS